MDISAMKNVNETVIEKAKKKTIRLHEWS